MSALKTCTRCKLDKPATTDEFYRDSARPDGLFVWCKQCCKEKRRQTTGQRPREEMECNNEPEGMKWCSGCKSYVSRDGGFYRSSRNRDGLVEICKMCRNSRDTRDHYMKTYGVSRQWVERLLEQQGFLCAVCPTPIDELKRGKSCLDHCHKSKKIRGILCHPCNVALGLLKDNPATIRSLLAYLQRGDDHSEIGV